MKLDCGLGINSCSVKLNYTCIEGLFSNVDWEHKCYGCGALIFTRILNSRSCIYLHEIEFSKSDTETVDGAGASFAG